MIILGTNSIKDTGFDVANSCNFEDGSLHKSVSSPSATFTISVWVKLSNQYVATSSIGQRYFWTGGGAGGASGAKWNSGNTGYLDFYNEGTGHIDDGTDRNYRDPSAWYHWVWKNSSGTGTLYVNGVQQGSTFSMGPLIGSGGPDVINIGRYGADTVYAPMTLAEFVYLDGTAATPTSFGEVNDDSGIWKPIDVSGLTFGTNGFHLDFEDSANLGNDANGGTDLTKTGTLVQHTDTPTNNFNTPNPLYGMQAIRVPVFAEGNLKITGDGDANHHQTMGTFAVNKGKWFWEAKFTVSADIGKNKIGIMSTELGSPQTDELGDQSGSCLYINEDGGDFRRDNATVDQNAGECSLNQIVSVALNMDDGEISIYRAGSLIVDALAIGNAAGTYVTPASMHYRDAGMEFNFGSPPYSESGGNSDGNGYGNYSMSVPSGYYSLNTKKLSGVWIMAYTIIDDPSSVFQCTLYSGNGGTQSITNDGNSDLQPDWVWIKQRSGTQNHNLQDSVRGSTKILKSNTNADETTDANGVTSFNTDGFSIGTRADINQSGTYVAWQWKAGTAFTNDASATGIGSIDSSGSVNETAGFSIVSYTGSGSAATVKHGLSTTPNVMIIKNRPATDGRDWQVYSPINDPTDALALNQADGTGDSDVYWNDTAPTSSVFSVKSGATNKSGDDIIGYIFSNRQGFSKFGSYTGNGNADGTFVYTGFKPAWVLCKASSINGEDWIVSDNKRNLFNETTTALFPNSASGDQSSNSIDMLSNGFKMRTTGTYRNQSGVTYIYMAFAENPFVTSTGVPACAR